METFLVYKSNALSEASYRLSLYEQRIMLTCIAQVRQDAPLTDQQLYTASAQQIADMAGEGLKTAYRDLKSASEKLFRREVNRPRYSGDRFVWVRQLHPTSSIEDNTSFLVLLVERFQCAPAVDDC